MAQTTLSFKDRKKAAAKTLKENKSNNTNRTCENCLNGIPSTKYNWNRSIIDNKPLTIRCTYYEEGKYGLLLNAPACSHFIKNTSNKI